MVNNSLFLIVLIAPIFCGWANDNVDVMVVTDRHFSPPISSVLASTDVITREDIDHWQAKTVSDVLKRLPGIDIVQYGSKGQMTSMFVRGTNAEQILVLIDGIRMASQGVMGSGDFNQIPMSLIQRIEFIRGARSAIYGSEAIGGVINIITQPQHHELTNKFEIGIGSHQYQLYDGVIRHKLGDFTKFTLAGAYEDTRGFNVSPHSPSKVNIDKDGFRSNSLLVEIEQQFSAEWSGFIRGYGYGNNIEYDQDPTYGGADERQLYSRTYDSSLLFQKNNYTSKLILSYQTYNDYNYQSRAIKNDQITTLDVITQQSAQWGNVYHLENAMISVGVDWREERTKPGTGYITKGYSRNNNGIYLIGQNDWKSVTVEGAVRTDDNQQFGRYHSWQSAIGWQLQPQHRLIFSYGTAFRAPTFGELYGFYGNDGLRPETSNQWEFGVENLGLIYWRLSAYRNYINELIEYDATIGKYDNNERVTIKGIELNGNVETGLLGHTVILEHIDPRVNSNGKTLARRSKYKAKYQLDWTMFHLDMNLSYQYNSKRYDDSLNNVYLPSYVVVDIATSYLFTEYLIIRARIANLLDKNYETAKGYETAGREYYLTGSYRF